MRFPIKYSETYGQEGNLLHIRTRLLYHKSLTFIHWATLLLSTHSFAPPPTISWLHFIHQWSSLATFIVEYCQFPVEISWLADPPVNMLNVAGCRPGVST